ncbi:10601_t:CDS:2 [Racocetra persica]|nr:10601_t:CDS:2 [Racocetra persica]
MTEPQDYPFLSKYFSSKSVNMRRIHLGTSTSTNPIIQLIKLNPNLLKYPIRCVVNNIHDKMTLLSEQECPSIRCKIAIVPLAHRKSQSTTISRHLTETTLIEVVKYIESDTEPFKKNFKKKNPKTRTIEYELELYENEPLEECTNGIQPSSVSSERAFSRAGFTLTSDRANISEKTVSSTILMNLWLVESQNEFSPLNALP